MVIWKNEVPYIVRVVDDLEDLIDKEIFEDVKEFIEDAIQDSEEVNRLEEECEQLEYQISDLEDENEELETTIEKLKDKLANYNQLKSAVMDFKEVLHIDELSKDQRYFFEQLIGVIEEVE